MSEQRIEPPLRDDRPIAEEAARWHEVLKNEGPEELAAFTSWLRTSPEHVRYFLFSTALDRELEEIDPERRVDVRALVAEASVNVVRLAKSTSPSIGARPPRSKKPWIVGVAAAISLFALALGAGLLNGIGVWQTFSTQIGEQRLIELKDGSIVHLNTSSQLKVRFRTDRRDIRLLSGEALFKVQQDTARPFRVLTGEATIQAVGTEFGVYRRDEDTRVVVLEGRVRVSEAASIVQKNAGGARVLALALSAGEEARIGPDGHIKRQPDPDVMKTVAWRQRRLVFREEALADIVTEFNRYNQTLKLRLSGFDGSARHYTGTFDADDPRSFAKLLVEGNDLTVQEENSELVIRER